MESLKLWLDAVGAEEFYRHWSNGQLFLAAYFVDYPAALL
jgi:hypothetical protein